MTLHTHEARKVLFVPHFNHTFRDMLPVALKLREECDYDPVFLIRWSDNSSSTNACREHDIKFVLTDDALQSAHLRQSDGEAAGHIRTSKKPLHSQAIKLLAKVPILRDVKYLAHQFRAQADTQRRASQLLAEIRPAALVMHEDRQPNLCLYMIQEANHLGIPSILFPHESVDTAPIFAEKRLQRGWTVRRLSLIEKLAHWHLMRHSPNISMEWRGEQVVWCPPIQALVAYWKGVFPRQPWVRGGSDVAWFAVQSPAYRDALIEAGVEPRKLIVTGYPPHDRLHALGQRLPEARLALCERLGISEECTIVCFADQLMEQYALYTPLEPVINDVLFAVQCFLDASPHAHVIYKLHPRNKRDDLLAPLSGHPRLSVVRDMDMQEVTAGSDLFVTQFSNSLYGALALGKPIIAFDFQKLGIYDLAVRHLEGIYQARSREQFRKLAQRLLAEPGELNQRTGTSAPQASRYVVCDGMAAQRLTDLIHYLAEYPSGDPNEAIAPDPSCEKTSSREVLHTQV